MNSLSSKTRIFSLGMLGFLLLTSKAQAGGPEQSTVQSEPQYTIDKPTVSLINTLNWENWSQPYWLNGNICRERDANTICLTPQGAMELRWNMPLAQKANQKTNNYTIKAYFRQ